MVNQEVKTLKPVQIYNRQCVIAEVVKNLLIKEFYYLVDGEGDYEVIVAPFDNCREYGYQYSILDAKIDYTFTVYEHRNSDQIIINGCLTSEIKPYGAYSGETKWDYIKAFGCNDYNEVAVFLAEYLLACYNGSFKDPREV